MARLSPDGPPAITRMPALSPAAIRPLRFIGWGEKVEAPPSGAALVDEAGKGRGPADHRAQGLPP